MLKPVIAFLFFTTLSSPQVSDSLKIQNISTPPDTLITTEGDTTSIQDTIGINEVTVLKDTLIPIQGGPLTDVSTIIDKRAFLFENYRYTGDLLRSFSLNFIKDLGFVGYNHETFIYGVGNNAISFLQDGVLLNNQFTNSLDLNLVQSEDIDSIEIVPSPRGFLYGPYNNPVTVNFITKDFITKAPYSRIKYYQGPDGEAMIDGKFSAKLADRWNLAFQLTNRSKDETYVNTDLSIWQFNTKLKYFLSNSINLLASYYYVDAQQGMNGGVDYDSLSRSSDDPNSDLYDPFAAPVLFTKRTLDVTQHNLSLRTLIKPFDNSQLDLSFYYRYGLDEFRDFRDTLNIHYEDKSKTYGGVLNYYYKFDIMTLQALGDYESTNHDDEVDNFERYGFCGILSANLLDNFIQPSVFYKRNYWGKNFRTSIGGIGADIFFKATQNQSLYIGYSLRENLYSDEENIPAFEIGTSYKAPNLMWDIKYFSNEYFYENSFEEGLGFSEQKIRGLGLSLNFKIWLLLFETNTFYYFKVENGQYYGIDYGRPINHPEWQFIGGFYINDLFFDNNLDLKTGFKFYYAGRINSFENIWYNYIDVDPTNKLDFTLASEIKKVAIFYFIWENLLGNEYYITPYYPMPERNIRFGLAWELFN